MTLCSRRFSRGEAGAALLWLISIVLLLSVSTSRAQPKVDPETGRIRLLVVGEATSGGNVYVMSILKSDPRIANYATILSGPSAPPDESRRQARIHFPRTKTRLTSTTDVINFLDCPPWAFSDEQQQWIHDAIRDEAMGCCWFRWVGTPATTPGGRATALTSG